MSEPTVGSGPAPDHLQADTVRSALDACVERIVGSPNATPRSGQVQLAAHIAARMAGGGTGAGEAPTGTGKSLAGLVPAMLAALDGQRTVISTGTLALQSQIAGKDGPLVADIVEKLHGRRPRLAVLKGWQNHVCPLALAATVGCEDGSPSGLLQAANNNGNPLYRWAAEMVAANAADKSADVPYGDRADCPVEADNETWATVSTSRSDCPGRVRCAWADHCLPGAARDKVADADIIVTNHSMLAVQAAIGAPVVVGSDTLGPVDHLIVDEAHTLAGEVRRAGELSLSGGRILSVVRSYERTARELRTGKQVTAVVTAGVSLARNVDTTLDRFLAGRETVRLEAETDPLDGLGETVASWVADARRSLRPPAGKAGHSAQVAWWRLSARFDRLGEEIRASASGRPGQARWVENDPRSGHAVLQASPVETAGPLAANLYADLTSVTAISATLPAGSVVELGIRGERCVYESPFADAYRTSLLFVPRHDAGAGTLSTQPPPGRFDTSAHPGWATPIIVRLVEANRGSALVLSATVSAGKQYAAALRAAAKHRWKVHSTWDGRSATAEVADWRADVGSVLVGTRGLMTGVDAPGETCTLVVVDRVPRAAGNPIDDARSEAIAERLEVDRWTADRFVYVSDAALLLEQAAGRLVRSVNDTGMVAVLDPRLLRAGPHVYPAPTRKALLDALGRFTSRTANLDQACDWLEARRRRTVTKSGRPAA